MYGCESWTVKKAECRITDAFELWCWRRLLRVPWTARRSNQSVLKEISPGCALEGLMLKLKTPVFWPPHAELTYWKRPWCWEGLGAGGEGDDRGWDGWMASPTRWAWVWANSGSWWWTGRPGVLRFMGLQRVGHDWTTERLSNWTDWVTDWRETVSAVCFKKITRASLVTQWWRIHLPMQETQVPFLVQEGSTCHGATKPLNHNNWACVLQPGSRNYWTHLPQLLKPTCLELVLQNQRKAWQ